MRLGRSGVEREILIVKDRRELLGNYQQSNCGVVQIPNSRPGPGCGLWSELARLCVNEVCSCPGKM